MSPEQIRTTHTIEKELVQEIRVLQNTLDGCEKEVAKLKAGHKKLEDSFKAYQEEKGVDFSRIRGD